jgi:hypothetical protein
MNAKRLLRLVPLVLVGSGLHAQNLVSVPERRQETLELMDRVLAPRPLEWPGEQLARLQPFSPVRPITVIAAVRPPVGPVTGPMAALPPPPPARLDDRAALALAARSIRPSGSMVSSRGRVLIMGGGNWAEGDVKNFNHDEQTYQVLVEKVSVEGYVLRLGTARLSRNFTDAFLDPASSIQTVPNR